MNPLPERGSAPARIPGRSTLIEVIHETVFSYSDDVSGSVMEVRLVPSSDETQMVRKHSLEVEPRTKLFPYTDYFGNTVHFFTVPARHRQLKVVSRSLVHTLPPDFGRGFDPDIDPEGLYEYLQFGGPVVRHPKLLEIAALFQHEDLSEKLDELNHYIHEELEYRPQSTSVDSTLEDVLAGKRGVCQDFAHLMIGVCREMQIPARYVSGYIYTNKAPGVRGQDASHAWCECYIPERGWVGYDPTNDLMVDERYVRVAVGRSYQDVPPTKGLYRGTATEEMTVSVHTAMQDALNPLEPV